MKVFLVAWCKLTARHVQGTIFCCAIGRSKLLLTLEITVSLYLPVTYPLLGGNQCRAHAKFGGLEGKN
jgi:hypothetical protein